MKIKTVTCPSLIKYAFLAPLVLALITFIPLCLLAPNRIGEHLASSAGIYILLTSVFVLLFRKAFATVTIDNEGIKSKNAYYGWDDDYQTKIISVSLLKFSLLPTIEIDLLCFSKQECNRFLFNKDKSCIFVTANSKNIEVIKELSGGRVVL